ncbi:TonB family protein [Hymenobacter pini]|uniref:TonB family protein n=1 Tax=Hymenobacter pini TaxID=2880879 RepID=UPI001CF1F31C|nr:TonB family protein [Hymenobacter pini]MCA8831836.1 energy transducer TonB [Hymenobacter pini]
MNYTIRALLVAAMLHSAALVHGQASSKNAKVYTEVEQMPGFPGGLDGLAQALNERLVYPADAINQKLEGRVLVEFVVAPSGKVADVEIQNGPHPLLNEAAATAIKQLPDFEPGRHKGKPVPVALTLPVTFRLPPNAAAAPPAQASSASSASTQEFARYPGGPEALSAYLSAVPYPEAGRATQAAGRVYVRFMVDASGKVGQIAAIVPKKTPQRRLSIAPAPIEHSQTTDPVLLQAAVQHVASMPTWMPAMLNGKPIATTRTVPVDFYPTAPTPAPEPVYAYADQMPILGGTTEKQPFPRSIYQALRYPAEALRQQLEGEVLVYFVVNEQGQVTQTQVIRSVASSLDAEALRVINSLPAGSPAMHQGKPVQVYYVVPVTFSIR